MLPLCYADPPYLSKLCFVKQMNYHHSLATNTPWWVNHVTSWASNSLQVKARSVYKYGGTHFSLNPSILRFFALFDLYLHENSHSKNALLKVHSSTVIHRPNQSRKCDKNKNITAKVSKFWQKQENSRCQAQSLCTNCQF